MIEMIDGTPIPSTKVKGLDVEKLPKAQRNTLVEIMADLDEEERDGDLLIYPEPRWDGCVRLVDAIERVWVISPIGRYSWNVSGTDYTPNRWATPKWRRGS